MSAAPKSLYPYQLGGSLDFNHPTYVVRQADKELCDSLKRGEFCYVLNSRQTGKSSLRVQTMHRLQAEGITCAEIDLTGIGSQNVTAEQWYGGIIQELVSSLELKLNRRTWWRDRNDLPPVQRFSEFIEKVLLAECSQHIVIFVDEIDSVLRLNFKDDFFAVIRACYNKRADKPEYKRVTFALLGVATPSDLIQDKNCTPFNIGRAIELHGFQLHEAQPLAKGLSVRVSNPQAVSREVLTWTGGQPFLTQKLCKLVLTSSSRLPTGDEAKWVEDLVRLQVIEHWEATDDPEHLKTIRDRILRSEQRAVRLLGLYQQILQQGEVAADGSPEQMELRLSGLVVEQQGKVRVYNRIYRSVFDKNWVDKELANLRPYAEALEAWVASNYQDESRLLRGQALQNAQAWVAGKSLNPLDYRFLSDSYKRETNQFLSEAQQKAELALEEEKKANQRLAQTQQKTKQTIRIGTAALATLSLVGATVATGLVNNANHKVNNANQKLAFAQSELQKTDSKNRKLETANREGERRLTIATQDRQSAEVQARQAEQVQQQARAAREKAEQKAQQINQDLASAQLELQKTESKNTDLETANREAGQKLQAATQQRQSAEAQAQQSKQVQQRAEIQAKEVANRAKQENIIALNLRSEGLLLLNDQLRALVASVKAGRQLLTTGAPSEIWKQTVSTLQQAVCGTQECRVQERNRLEGHEDWISGLSFSPDGQMIASSSRDQTVKLWSRDGRLLKTLKGHGNWLHNSVSFSPDGQIIASASNKNTIKLLSREGTLLGSPE